MLYMASLIPQQTPPLPRNTSQGTEFIPRSEGSTQKTETHKLLEPLAVQNIRFSASDIFDVPSIHEVHRKAL
jgi:hypothetical protein